MNKLDNEVICSQIVVDCAPNDNQDIRMGGPQYLGYDFFVLREQADEMLEHVKNVIHQTGAPLIRAYIGDTVVKTTDQVWTKERIAKCIQNNEADIDTHLFEKNLGREQ